MAINLIDKSVTITRGGDGVARSYDPNGDFRSQIGRETVALVPTQSAPTGSATRITFAFPFAEHECISSNDIKVLDSTGVTEYPAYIEPILSWQSWEGSSLKSVRSASISIEITLANTVDTVDVIVVWGEGGSSSVLPASEPDEGWVNYRHSGLQWGNYINVPSANRPAYDYDGTGYGMPVEEIYEPHTWALLSPAYMKKTGVFGYNIKFNTNDSDLSVCMDFYENAARTMTNEVGDHVNESYLTPYFIKEGPLGNAVEPAHYASWLFDRASALWGLYAMTGELKHLIQAHRASEYYATKLVTGAFSLKDFRDLKYTYPKSLIYDVLMTGNVKLLNHIDDIIAFQDSWDHNYVFTPDKTTIWTERHLAYKLDSYRVAYEVYGTDYLKNKTIELFETGYNLQQNPVNGWAKDGSIRHTFNVHEGWAGDGPCASPWMASLFAGAVKSYYDISGDARALRMLADLGTWIVDYGTRDWQSDGGATYAIPWYFANDEFYGSDASQGKDDPFTDIVHCYDVGSLVLKGVWAKQLLNESSTVDLALAKSLFAGAAYKFLNLHRTSIDTENAGATFWRIAPTRSFNWWFVNGYDVIGLMEIVNDV